ncbi:regulatory protein, gntR family [Roseateles sp. YR242]|uniref:GntR family transcriptional regulator n=1 Tax=Roseateles sp. YR242 TaxID=1855305 RepID=UPI0008B690FB|nr:GntR family transcriptional regulator [Roseateles sp. YR242]SEK64850.1 regulatory protein, gntR family [Roseateles sp. YR242]
MNASPNALLRHLEQLSADAEPGQQLPTIRELMRRFGASQAMVQRAFQELKALGLIESQVGRGTYFLSRAPSGTSTTIEPVHSMQRRTTGAGAAGQHGTASTGPANGPRAILLLRRSVSVARGRLLVEGLQRRFSADGHQVLEVAYNDPLHALTVLKGLPRFDACVVQSTFRTIPIALLAALREKTDVVAIDGASLAGADVEAVGTEWSEPLAIAVGLLKQRQHQHIAFATTSHPLLSVQLARRRLSHLAQDWPGISLTEIALPLLPDEAYATALVEHLAELLSRQGRLPFTGLVAWGIEDSAGWRAQLESRGISVPRDLSVALLARPDLPNEHAHFFDVVGASIEDQIAALHAAVTERWASPGAPFGVRLVPVRTRAGQSIAAPARARRALPRQTA